STPSAIVVGWMKKVGAAVGAFSVSYPKVNVIDTVASPDSVSGDAICRLTPALSSVRLSGAEIGVLVLKAPSVIRNSPCANWPSTAPACAGSALSAAARASIVGGVVLAKYA